MLGTSTRSWEETQISVFTKWCNSFLKKRKLRVNDINHDFCDGTNLINLIEIISGKEIGVRWHKSPKQKVQMIENCNFAINFITNDWGVKLVNIGGQDIVDGNVKLILGLVWSVIVKVQIDAIRDENEAGAISGKDKLLAWCKEMVAEIPTIHINDFSKSWASGLPFSGIIHHFFPDIVDMKKTGKDESILVAFQAMNDLGMDIFIDPVDIEVDAPDEKSIITQVSAFYHFFNSPECLAEAKSRLGRIKTMALAIERLINNSSGEPHDIFEKMGKEIQHIHETQFLRFCPLCAEIFAALEAMYNLLLKERQDHETEKRASSSVNAILATNSAAKDAELLKLRGELARLSSERGEDEKMKQQIAELQAELGRRDDEILQMEANAQSARAAFAEKATEIDSLKLTIAQKNAEINQHVLERQRSSENLRQLREEAATREANLAAANAQIERAKTIVEEARNEAAQAREEAAVAKAALHEKEAENESIRKQAAVVAQSLNQTTDQAAADIANMKRELVKQSEQARAAQEEANRSREEAKKMQEEAAAAKAAAFAAQQEAVRAKAEAERAQADARIANEQAETAKAEAEAAKAESERQSVIAATISEKIKENETQKRMVEEGARESREAADREIDDLKRELEEVRKEAKQAREEVHRTVQAKDAEKLAAISALEEQKRREVQAVEEQKQREVEEARNTQAANYDERVGKLQKDLKNAVQDAERERAAVASIAAVVSQREIEVARLRSELNEAKIALKEAEEAKDAKANVIEEPDAPQKERRIRGLESLILGMRYEYGHGILKDEYRALIEYQNAADDNIIEGSFAVARLLEQGRGTTKNERLAANLYRQATDEGHFPSMNNLAAMLLSGRGIAQDEKEAAELFKKAADNGCVAAQCNYAILLDTGRAVEKDELEALKYWRLAAEAGHPRAINNLAYRLENGGKGIEKNPQEARNMYRQAAAHGHVLAQFNASLNESTPAKMFETWHEAAKWGAPAALNNYGVITAEGKNGPKDEVEGAALVKAAAEKGEPEALFNYAMMLMNATGVEKNMRGAARLLKIASDKGFAKAQNNLGVMFINGDTVKLSPPDGIALLRKAADQGDPDALMNLALLLQTGKCVPKNLVEAQRYFKLAFGAGNKLAKIYIVPSD